MWFARRAAGTTACLIVDQIRIDSQLTSGVPPNFQLHTINMTCNRITQDILRRAVSGDTALNHKYEAISEAACQSKVMQAAKVTIFCSRVIL